ncbi:hypothetical protein CBS101457_004960 [Exobasidium rhododendri]|nr:hypothetical protein CBS101457_004960 [Exobasidium rhododendri]
MPTRLSSSTEHLVPHTGSNGSNGINGSNSMNGSNGINGSNSMNGSNGINGSSKVHELSGVGSISSTKAQALDVDKILSQLTLQEKISLMTGDGWWHTVAIPRLGVPAIRMSDGPNGIRGTRFFRGTPASCFPCATALAASFDLQTVERVGRAIAQECIAKGVHIWLGPTMNTQRSPLGGRGFESFSEDPLLQGLIGSSIIKGAQSSGVSATQKHYVANDAELNRFQSNSNVSEKALREIYLKPFQIVCSDPSPDAIPWATMSAYNRVNGTHASESPRLLDDILRKEWGWDGLIMSDWTGTYSTVEAIRAGLDIEMPGPTVVRGLAIGRAIAAGKLLASEVDAPVRNILQSIRRAQLNNRKFDQPELSVDTPEMRSVLHDAACASTVLLKNDASILPLRSLKQTAADSEKRYAIAVIGPNSHPGSISGGGSASLLPSYSVSVKDAIMAEGKKSGLDDDQVGWAQGVYAHRFMPSLAQYMADKDGLSGHATLSFYNNLNFVGEPVWIVSVNVRLGTLFFVDGIPDEVPEFCSCRLEATFMPSRSGPWEFGIYSAGRAKLFIDDEVVVDNWSEDVWQRGEAFFGIASTERRGVCTFTNEDVHPSSCNKLRIDFQNDPALSLASPFVGGRGGIGFGGVPQIDQKTLRAEAVELATQSEEVVLVVGLNGDWESEGYDRGTLALPAGTDELVEAVLAANPRTVVVMQSGMPVEMPWVDRCPTLLQSWYAGNEHGNAVASVLFGRFAPHGRLPLTYPKSLRDCPNYLTFPETHHNGLYGTIEYNEGSNVGYRYYAKTKTPILFEFGHGLSYTEFDWQSLQLTAEREVAFDAKTQLMRDTKAKQDLVWELQVRVTNTGRHASKEVVQLYSTHVGAKDASPELRQFAMTKELAPGQSEEVVLHLRLSDLSIWNEAHLADTSSSPGCWQVLPGKYQFSLGRSCQKMESCVEVTIQEQQELRWKGIVTRLS